MAIHLQPLQQQVLLNVRDGGLRLQQEQDRVKVGGTGIDEAAGRRLVTQAPEISQSPLCGFEIALLNLQISLQAGQAVSPIEVIRSLAQDVAAARALQQLGPPGRTLAPMRFWRQSGSSQAKVTMETEKQLDRRAGVNPHQEAIQNGGGHDLKTQDRACHQRDSQGRCGRATTPSIGDHGSAGSRGAQDRAVGFEARHRAGLAFRQNEALGVEGGGRHDPRRQLGEILTTDADLAPALLWRKRPHPRLQCDTALAKTCEAGRATEQVRRRAKGDLTQGVKVSLKHCRDRNEDCLRRGTRCYPFRLAPPARLSA